MVTTNLPLYRSVMNLLATEHDAHTDGADLIVTLPSEAWEVVIHLAEHPRGADRVSLSLYEGYGSLPAAFRCTAQDPAAIATAVAELADEAASHTAAREAMEEEERAAHVRNVRRGSESCANPGHRECSEIVSRRGIPVALQYPAGYFRV